jgi:UDP-N-acetylmuramoylalanine--D-glutamate ligase
VKTSIVLGLARSGLATVRALVAQGNRVIAVDDDPEKGLQAKALGAQVVGMGNISWDDVDRLIQSPGVPLWFPEPHPVTAQARHRGIPICGEGDLFRAAHPNARLVGITGTNGKSTTTALVGHILKKAGLDCQVGGNIGIPMMDLPPADIYVLELSSYQLDLSHNLDLDVAAWINLSEDHLDRHGSMEAYSAAKQRIFHTTKRAQTAIIGIDDDLSEAVWRQMSEKGRSVIPVSVTRPTEISGQGGWLTEGSDRLLEWASLSSLKGDHNFQNGVIAYGICRALSIVPEDIIRGIQTFPGLAHRQEWVRTLNSVCFINDSKATNASATATALTTFEEIYWIAGGVAKQDGIEPLAPFFSKIRHAFLIGQAQDRFGATLEGKVSYTKSQTLEQAVKQAYELSKENSRTVILLSPACASFDQFRDFEHRGDVFRHLVEGLT